MLLVELINRLHQRFAGVADAKPDAGYGGLCAPTGFGDTVIAPTHSVQFKDAVLCVHANYFNALMHYFQFVNALEEAYLFTHNGKVGFCGGCGYVNCCGNSDDADGAGWIER